MDMDRAAGITDPGDGAEHGPQLFPCLHPCLYTSANEASKQPIYFSLSRVRAPLGRLSSRRERLPLGRSRVRTAAAAAAAAATV